jgi:hypothetical protein
MLRKKTTKRMMKMHLDNIQVSGRSIENMQEGINEFVEMVCRTSKELLDKENSLRKIHKLNEKKRISEIEIIGAIKRVMKFDEQIVHQSQEANLKEAESYG